MGQDLRPHPVCVPEGRHTVRLYHGGVPNLRPGDILEPGHDRQVHPGCPWCEARRQGTSGPAGIDPPSQRPDVHMTPHRLYATHYASLYGYGDLYQVEPIGEAVRSTEDSLETWCAPTAVILTVIDRAVRLTNSERRRLARQWITADQLTWGTP